MAAPCSLDVYDDFVADDSSFKNRHDHGCEAANQSPRLLCPEAKAWADQVVSRAERRPQEPLFKLLRGRGRKYDRTPQVVNAARALIGKAFAFSGPEAQPALASACLALFRSILFVTLTRALEDFARQMQLPSSADMSEDER